MRLLFIGLILLGLSKMSQAQFVENYEPEIESVYNIGLGLGMDYGGLGARFNYRVVQKFQLFGGFGYNFNGAGLNAGGAYRFSPGNKVCPTLSAMYGYNAVIVVQGASEYNKTYYGPSFGFGVEYKPRSKDAKFWNFEIFIPVRSSEFQNDFDALKANPGIEINDMLPFTISIGYHWER
jgi:hypothetical protein